MARAPKERPKTLELSFIPESPPTCPEGAVSARRSTNQISAIVPAGHYRCKLDFDPYFRRRDSVEIDVKRYVGASLNRPSRKTGLGLARYHGI
jgi:hypothetical protein